MSLLFTYLHNLLLQHLISINILWKAVVCSVVLKWDQFVAPATEDQQTQSEWEGLQAYSVALLCSLVSSLVSMTACFKLKYAGCVSAIKKNATVVLAPAWIKSIQSCDEYLCHIDLKVCTGSARAQTRQNDLYRVNGYWFLSVMPFALSEHSEHWLHHWKRLISEFQGGDCCVFEWAENVSVVLQEHTDDVSCCNPLIKFHIYHVIGTNSNHKQWSGLFDIQMHFVETDISAHWFPCGWGILLFSSSLNIDLSCVIFHSEQ